MCIFNASNLTFWKKTIGDTKKNVVSLNSISEVRWLADIDFPAEFRPEIGRKPFHTIIPPSKKKWAPISRWTLDFPQKNVLYLHFGQNKVYYLRSLKSLN